MPDKQSIERHSTRKMGRELHETLNQQGLTQAEAAKQVGVTHNEERCFSVCLPTAMTPELAPREHVAYQWMPLETAALRATSWSNVAALRHLQLQFSPIMNMRKRLP